MAFEEVRTLLFGAVATNDVEIFNENVDLFNLNEATFSGGQNLLHLSTIYGCNGIVREILQLHPRMAQKLDHKKCTALHYAAEYGNVNAAKCLMFYAKETRRYTNSEGFNPAYVAAQYGQVAVLKALLDADRHPAKDTISDGRTILHICVENEQLASLQYLTGILSSEFISRPNAEGDTLLHHAVRYEQIEMIRYLVDNHDIPKHATNLLGKTAWDVASVIPADTKIFLAYPETDLEATRQKIETMSMNMQTAASVFIGITSAAMSNPPGGVYGSSEHNAGISVWAEKFPVEYLIHVICNSFGFWCSLLAFFSIHLTLVFKKHFLYYCNKVLMICSGLSIALNFLSSTMVLSSETLMLVGIVYYVYVPMVASFIIMCAVWFIKYLVGRFTCFGKRKAMRAVRGNRRRRRRR